MSYEYSTLRAAFHAGARIQVWTLREFPKSSNDGYWRLLGDNKTHEEPQFSCEPHLYRIYPEDMYLIAGIRRSDDVIERLRALANEYRPTMNGDVLHAWAKDVTEAITELGQEVGAVADAMTLSAPPKVWLQVDTGALEDDEREEIPRDCWDQLTWCAESLGGHEVVYIREDLATPPLPSPPRQRTQPMSDVSRDIYNAFGGDVSYSIQLVQVAFQEAAWAMSCPSVLMRPTLSIDGNMWCALYGHNLVEGVAGFGESPALAMADFDKNWNQKIKRKDDPADGQ